MLDSLYTKDQVKYLKSIKTYVLPDESTCQGVGISRYLYTGKVNKNSKPVKTGINVHKLIENNDRSHVASNSILNWYDDNLTGYKQEAFCHGELYGESIVGYIDTIGYNRYNELVIIDNKITSKPIEICKNNIKWSQQLVSYVLLIHQMTGELASKCIVLACHPETGKLNSIEIGLSEYSQIQMSLKALLTK